MAAPPPPLPRRVHVLGANGRSGAALCRALSARGVSVVPLVRAEQRRAFLSDPDAARIAAIEDGPALARALADAEAIACTAHARHAPAVLAAAPPAARLLFLGSTRKFTRWPDAHGNGVLAGERAVLGSGRDAAILHPTMIYGATGENNVRRLAALLRRLPVWPLPGGGRASVQPVHQDDLTDAILAALSRPWSPTASLVVCGPAPVRYRDFVRAVAHAAGLAPRPVVPVPAAPLMLAARLAAVLPGLPRIGSDEIRRLGEDKAFDPASTRDLLGRDPVSLADGLRRTFAA